MNKTTLNVLMIEDDPIYAALVQQWLAGAGGQVSLVLHWSGTLGAGLTRLSQGGVDVILLDLGLPDSEGVETYIAVRANAPGIPIVGLSAGDNEALAVKMIQECEDYLVKCTCTQDLLVRALRYAVVRRQTQAGQRNTDPGQRAHMVGVLGVKGGVGTTTIACYLAGELRGQTKQEVLLADLDLEGGMASFVMGLESKYSMLDAAVNVDRLDHGVWGALVDACPNGLEVISSPSAPAVLDMVAMSRVVTKVRAFYKWVVADLGRLNVASTNLLHHFDEVFVITSTSVGALYQAKRAVSALVANGLDIGRLRLIVNHVDRGVSLTGTDLNSIVGIPVFATLPHDRLQLQEACVGKRLPNPDSAFGSQIVKLARKVAGLNEKPDKRGSSELFSFVERFRKSRDLVAIKQP